MPILFSFEPGGWLIQKIIIIDYFLVLFSEPRRQDSINSKDFIMSSIVLGSIGNSMNQ